MQAVVELELAELLEEAAPLFFVFPTEQNKVFSCLGLRTFQAVVVLNRIDAAEKSREGGVACSELGDRCGSVPGETGKGLLRLEGAVGTSQAA